MYYDYGTVFPEYDKLQELVERRLVRKSSHSRFPLDIYNYTQDAQQGWMWNHEPVLFSARGLVLEGNRVVAQGFRKFFNHGDSTGGTEPIGEAVITEKLDGSMILSFQYDGEIVTATRGSFDSPQAVLALSMYPFKRQVIGTTFMWELIGPSNRHVVNYKDDVLVCLGFISSYGTDVCREALEIEASAWGFPLVSRVNVQLDDVLGIDSSTGEGFIYSIEQRGQVVFRSKIKFPTYLAAHRIVSQEKWTNSAYEAWVNYEVEPLLDILPDFYRNEVREYVKRLEVRSDYVDAEVSSLMDRCQGDPTDKAQRAAMARIINQHPEAEIRTATYARLSGKKYTIKPV